MTENTTGSEKKRSTWFPYFMTIGLAVGVTVGIITGTLALYIAIGLAVGAALDAVQYAKARRH